MSNRTFAELFSATLVINGLETAELSNSLALINGHAYFSQNVLHAITGEYIEYDQAKNVMFYGNQNRVSKHAFSDISDILYNGQVYWKYSPAGTSSFVVAGKEYNDGFVIGCDHSLFGDGDGYALFNLQGKYTEMEFDVGKTDDYELWKDCFSLCFQGFRAIFAPESAGQTHCLFHCLHPGISCCGSGCGSKNKRDMPRENDTAGESGSSYLAVIKENPPHSIYK